MHSGRICLLVARTPDGSHAAYHTHVDVLAAVIKPIFGAASIGVVRVDNLEQLEKAYQRVVAELKRAKIVAGALEQADDEELSAAGAQQAAQKVGSETCTAHKACAINDPSFVNARSTTTGFGNEENPQVLKVDQPGQQ